MIKQMAWLSPTAGDETKILHLRIQAGQPWRPYTAFPQFAVPDYRVPKGSLGFATFQKLLREGWAVIASQDAQMSVGVQLG